MFNRLSLGLLMVAVFIASLAWLFKGVIDTQAKQAQQVQQNQKR